jgi:hypothetical protein
MADQSLFQGSQHSQALLAQRREITSDAAEGLSASWLAETIMAKPIHAIFLLEDTPEHSTPRKAKLN